MSEYAKMTVVQLRAACKKAKLDEKGLKAELVARLDAAMTDAPEAASEAEPEEEKPKARTSGRKRKTTKNEEEEEKPAVAASDAEASEAEGEAEAEEEEQPKKKTKTSTKKAAPKKAAKGKGKKAAAAAAEEEEDEEEEEAPATPASAAPAKAAASSAPAKKQVYKVDPASGMSYGSVFENYDAMLNQTNIGANNNKFYRIQVIQSGNSFYCFTHWGRVSEHGDTKLQPCGSSSAAAVKAFCQKFKDKTKNNWDDRANFKKVKGKYDLLEMDNSVDDDELALEEERIAAALGGSSRSASPVPTKYRPSALKPEIQELMAMIFDTGVFKSAMKKLEIDVEKMPLGKLSKAQIQKGYDILGELEENIKGKRNRMSELSSLFYTRIPHNFGRMIPPPITTLEQLKEKQDLLNVLNDIEIAQSLQEDAKKKAREAAKKEQDEADIESLPPNPIDDKYATLKCDLDVLDKNSKEYKIIEKYIAATGGYGGTKIEQIYTVDRHTEDKRFSEHKDLKNRRLCWHGTNVAVVAAILNSGLRIMPHSGGRVGKGIYLASEHSKSAGYVRSANFNGKNSAIMFLVEGALGKEHTITQDDSSLVKAPSGYDCIVARGRVEPDPSKDVMINIDGNDVAVPQASPIPQPKYANSSFSQSEYLLYKESQHRIRYAIKFAWSH